MPIQPARPIVSCFHSVWNNQKNRYDKPIITSLAYLPRSLWVVVSVARMGEIARSGDRDTLSENFAGLFIRQTQVPHVLPVGTLSVLLFRRPSCLLSVPLSIRQFHNQPKLRNALPSGLKTGIAVTAYPHIFCFDCNQSLRILPATGQGCISIWITSHEKMIATSHLSGDDCQPRRMMTNHVSILSSKERALLSIIPRMAWSFWKCFLFDMVNDGVCASFCIPSAIRLETPERTWILE